MGFFRTHEQGIALRAYMRQHETLLRKASEPIQHMQKALRQMNLLLDNVVADITGKTGIGIINAILKGKRNPVKLARLRDGRCKHDEKTIALSLEGHYRKEHLFSLHQAVEIYNFYQQQIVACGAAIEEEMTSLESKGNQDNLPPSRKRRSKSSFLIYIENSIALQELI